MATQSSDRAPLKLWLNLSPTSRSLKRLQNIHNKLKLNDDPTLLGIGLRSCQSSGVTYYSVVYAIAKEAKTDASGRKISYMVEYKPNGEDLEDIIKGRGQLECVLEVAYQKMKIECMVVPRDAENPYGNTVQKQNHWMDSCRTKSGIAWKRSISTFSKAGKRIGGLFCFAGSTDKAATETFDEKICYVDDSDYDERVDKESVASEKDSLSKLL